MVRTYREHVSAERPRQVRGGCALAIEAGGGDAKRLRSRERGPRLAGTPFRRLMRNFMCEYAPVGCSLGAINLDQEERDWRRGDCAGD